jgi:hypothetical protein
MSEENVSEEYDSSCDTDNSYSTDSSMTEESNNKEFASNGKDSKINKTTKKQSMKRNKLPLKEALKTVEERSLFTKINKFFTSECDINTINEMVKIIKEEKDKIVSLRLINWFAMKHSATMESLEVTNDSGNIELFDVKISYRARLNTHSKKYFDPFRRGPKFDYQYDKNDDTKTVETTLCQLNFFRWLIMHNLLNYIKEHIDVLQQKSGKYNNAVKKKKEIKKEKEKEKKNVIKNKKEDIKLKIKRFTEDNSNKLVIIM